MSPAPAEGTDLSGHTVLAIFAHPDDESIACGGTLARLADRGVRVVLLCASRGERGSLADPTLVPDGNLGNVRARELEAAAKVLGISEVILLNHPDGELRWANAQQLHDQIVQALVTYKPDVVITFDADGLYWHLDHIGIHEHTREAMQELGAAAPALYFVTLPRGVVRGLTNVAVENGHVPPGSTLWGITPDAFGLLTEPHDLNVDVTAWVPRKLAALHCHRTQMGVTNPFAHMSEADARRWLSHEHFRREPINPQRSLLDLIGEPA